MNLKIDVISFGEPNFGATDKFKYEMENICQLFFPDEKVYYNTDETNPPQAISARLEIQDDEAGSNFTAFVSVFQDAPEVRESRFSSHKETPIADLKKRELLAGVTLYNAFSKALGFKLEWGAITGVRPVKLFRSRAEVLGLDGVEGWFRNSLLVSERKTNLCREVFGIENEILNISRPESFSLYISIPFCPTRCGYCSFVSHTVEKAAGLIPQYLENLCEELRYTAEIVKAKGLRLETVYVGGGTPTALTAPQLDVLLGCVRENFDLSTVREYTVEAGRPDTITVEKMAVLKNAGVSRVSINPQTLHDKTLNLIGRSHSVAEFYSAFEIAKNAGFKTINVDLIAALPGESLEDFKMSVDGVIALNPENITVHTLALKRASDITQSGYTAEMHSYRSLAVDMVAYSQDALRQSQNLSPKSETEGYLPYYLYRQSRVVGNMENVGWAIKGHEGLYNVYIMDETHSIIACGAGAVTKLKNPFEVSEGELKIKRIFNFKFPYEYVKPDKFQILLERKNQINEFYEKTDFSSGKAW